MLEKISRMLCVPGFLSVYMEKVTRNDTKNHKRDYPYLSGE